MNPSVGTLPDIKMTVPQFLQWWGGQNGDQRYELVDGEIVAMGRDSMRHNLAKVRALDTLRAAVARAGVQCTVFSDGVAVAPDERTYRIPDALVHCGEFDATSSVSDNPVVVVEVVSITSEERDEHAKLHDYFIIPSIAHYLIVYDHKHYIVHHRRTGAGPVETTFVSTGEITLDPPGVRICVGDLFGEIDR